MRLEVGGLGVVVAPDALAGIFHVVKVAVGHLVLHWDSEWWWAGAGKYGYGGKGDVCVVGV